MHLYALLFTIKERGNLELKDKNLYYVGGVVRDEFLNIPSFDVDLCYEGNAIDFVKDMNILRENPDFGTVRILFDGKELDIASTREEIYPKAGHLPAVTIIGCPLRDDLKRRDFTINALAKNTVTGEIIDYFGGIKDIQEKKIRVLHNNSFIEDPSRIIRALKFSVRFNFELDKTTLELQEEYLKNINYDMSYHRLKKELIETFNLNKDAAYEKFINLNIYRLLGKNQKIPVLKTKHEDFIKEFLPQKIWIIYLGTFNLENFELTSDEKEIIDSYNKIKQIFPKTDFETYNLFKNLPIESILLYGLTEDYNIAYNYLKNLRHVKINITGEDLKELGIPEGKIYREIFDYITKEKVKNKTLQKEDEIKLVRDKFV